MNEKLFESAIADFDYLNKVMIESCAQVAFNSVIFESALADTLNEAEDGESKNSSVKNAAFKALEAVKRAAQTIFNKIKVAINEFIAKANQYSVTKAIDSWKKSEKFDLSATASVKPAKFLGIDDPAAAFAVPYASLLNNMNDEKAVAGIIAKSFASKLGDNYADAKKALAAAESFGDVNKVYTGLVGYAMANEDTTFEAEKYIDSVPDLTETSKAVKDSYKKASDAVNGFIKDYKKTLDSAADDEKAAQVKAHINVLNKLLGTVHASFIGYMKWSVASNRQALVAIKSAKKGKVEPANESFMGLALL